MPVDPVTIRTRLLSLLPSLAVTTTETERALDQIGEYPDTEEGRRAHAATVERLTRREG
jgi:hypothetical protein